MRSRQILGAAGALGALAVSLFSAGAARADALWTSRYDGTGAGADTAKAVAVDASGNVYVTGVSVGTGVNPGTTDFATLKYNSAGVQQWASRFDGLGKHNDGGEAVVVDGSGNVYVAGWARGVGSGADYATIKYNASGVKQWSVIDQGPGGGDDKIWAMAIDSSNNIYVTGSYTNAAGDTDIHTVKYSSGGVELWSANYSAGAGDAGFAIQVDASGNVYVAGRSGASGSYNYRVLKYNSSGVQQWSQSYNGPAGTNDEAYALAVDSSGNAYVTGYSNGSGTGSDYATIKLNSSGVQQWASRFNGAYGGSDAAGSIGLDSSGNVYVTGASMDSAATSGWATLKYNASGVLQWTKREDSGAGADGARKLVVSGDDIYVVGGFTVTAQGQNMAVARYDSDGVTLFSALYNGVGNGTDCVYDVATDASKNILVTGCVMGSSVTGCVMGSSDDYATQRYNHIKLDTSVMAGDVSGYGSGSVNLTATLKRSMDNSARSGKTVSFQVDGVSVGSAVTDASGVATLAYTIPANAALGSKTITATFAGDIDYNASSDTGTLNVRKKPTLAIYDRSGCVTMPVNLRALMRVDNINYPNATIQFKVDGIEVGTAVTNENGVAVMSHTLVESIGSHVLTASFNGDSTIAPFSSGNANLTVKIIKSSISVASYVKAPGNIVNMKATLKGGDTPLDNKTLTFKIDGVEIGTANTNADGIAVLTHTAAEALGTHTITVEYAGQAGLYSSATGSGVFTLLLHTRISADKISAPAGSSVNYGATLTRAIDGLPLEGKTLSFYDGATLLGTAVTNAAGRAEISITAPAQGVKQTITVRFAGEPTLRMMEKMGSITGL
jgi:uncharacterized delta-60 repeat protein